MTDKQIAEQILRAADGAVKRSDGADREKELKAAYMTGISQACSMLIRGEGLVDARQLERAVVEAGKGIGLVYDKPH